MWEPKIKISCFGNSQFDLHNVTVDHGVGYSAPEILDGVRPYDGEKADVFASSFILLAIFTHEKFSSYGHGKEQVVS
jgi:hypothetical protein